MIPIHVYQERLEYLQRTIYYWQSEADRYIKDNLPVPSLLEKMLVSLRKALQETIDVVFETEILKRSEYDV